MELAIAAFTKESCHIRSLGQSELQPPFRVANTASFKPGRSVTTTVSHFAQAIASFRTVLTRSTGRFNAQFGISMALLSNGEPEAESDAEVARLLQELSDVVGVVPGWLRVPGTGAVSSIRDPLGTDPRTQPAVLLNCRLGWPHSAASCRWR